MERICKICNQSKKTPYKDVCRNCYQKKWIDSIPLKTCNSCNETFKNSGITCFPCLDKIRKEKSRLFPCSICNRIGLIIINQTDKLCTKCDRHKRETEDPSRADVRRYQVRQSSRKQRGSDLNAPIRKPKGWRKTSTGYILTYKSNHPNSNVNGCIFQHTFVMSEFLKRPLTIDENVHHINGIRDDNRIENLELWSKSQPCGQRVSDKIKWAKEILNKYKEMC